jgi:hypothetical protein
MEAKDFEPYVIGVMYASICTSLPIEEAVKRMNEEHPAGTLMNSWELCRDKTFRTGQPNPCQCPDHPETHKHYLLNC